MKENDFQKYIINYLTTHGYELGDVLNFDKDFCIDREKLFSFLEKSQPKKMRKLKENQTYQHLIMQAINRKAKKSSVIDVWKDGVEVDGEQLDLAYFAPNDTINPDLQIAYELNIISITEELTYSKGNKNRIDLCIFVNGIPFALFELKNRGTGQSYKHGIDQWKKDRDASETLFQQVPVFFSLDSQEAYLTTNLQGEKTFFLPFNKGKNGGAGNPIVEGKYSTHYVWEEVFQKDNVLDLINNFVFKDAEGTFIFPRYHQWEALRKIKQALLTNGKLQNYLFNHSAGSGKTYTITWLAYLLSKLFKDGKKLFDSVIVLTDRIVLDAQLQSSISHIRHQKGVVEVIDQDSQQLADAINSSCPIVITTIQKFAYAKDKIATASGKKQYAIIVDEAHSSQTGKNAQSLREALHKKIEVEKKQDKNNHLAFFAFTATPKEDTLRLFGSFDEEKDKYVPFHVYSMKQAIEEGFILDVLKNYTTYEIYCKLLNNSPHNPIVDKKEAKRIIQGIVKEETIPDKTPIIVDHFHQKARPLLNGQGKAMVVASSIRQAMLYKLEIDKYLEIKKYPYKTIVAFTGETNVNGKDYTEETANGFPSSEIVQRFKSGDYHILIVANKFQTGFDEKRLVSMYIDKSIREVQAVQTLSRLNRVMNGKDQTFILDFANKVEEIQQAFAEFYEGAEVPDGSYSYETLLELERKLLHRYQIITKEQLADFRRIQQASNKDEKQKLVYNVLQKSQEVYDKLGNDQKQVLMAIREYVKIFNWLKLIRSFDNEEGRRLSLLNSMCYWLNRYLTALNDPIETERTKREVIEGLIEVANVHISKKHEGNIEIDKTEKETKKKGSIGSFPSKEEDFLNHILREQNEQMAREFPMLQSLYKDYPEDVKWLIEHIENHNEIERFIHLLPEKPEQVIGEAKKIGMRGLRGFNKNGELFKQVKGGDDKFKESLFQEILDYIRLKFIKYKK